MGLMDDLKNNLFSKSGVEAAAMGALIPILFRHAGGLSGLTEKFQSGGLGHLVQSWTGTGQNLPLNSDQIERALGPDLLEKISQEAHQDPQAVKQQLSEHLPQIVDQLTPNGNIPQNDSVGHTLKSIMSGIFGS